MIKFAIIFLFINDESFYFYNLLILQHFTSQKCVDQDQDAAVLQLNVPQFNALQFNAPQFNVPQFNALQFNVPQLNALHWLSHREGCQ